MKVAVTSGSTAPVNRVEDSRIAGRLRQPGGPDGQTEHRVVSARVELEIANRLATAARPAVDGRDARGSVGRGIVPVVPPLIGLRRGRRLDAGGGDDRKPVEAMGARRLRHSRSTGLV